MADTDQTLLNELQYTATETPNLGASWPSGLWTVDELSGYLNQRQRRILYETGSVLTRNPGIPIPANTQRTNLPADWIQTRRATWLTPDNKFSPLLRSEIWYLDYGVMTWEETFSQVPLVFLEDVVPNLQILIAPMSADDGVIELIYVSVGAPTTVLANTGVPFIIPGDLVPILKWGVLADMFGKIGRAHDAARAEYAEARFNLGICVVNSLLWGEPTSPT
jgi:hypothetical protein